MHSPPVPEEVLDITFILLHGMKAKLFVQYLCERKRVTSENDVYSFVISQLLPLDELGDILY